MKSILLGIVVLCVFTAQGQTMKDAEKHFKKYEYKHAFDTYKVLYGKESFSTEELKRYSYSSFAIGEFQTCYDILPSLVSLSDIEPFFFYMNGEVCMHLKKYDEAKVAYDKYQKMDDERNVSVKIESCDQIPNWTSMEYLTITGLDNNSSKADNSGMTTSTGNFEFHELGMDSIGGGMATDAIDNSELLIMRPYFKDAEGVTHPVLIDQLYQYASIGSLVVEESNGLVLLSIAEPMSKDPNKLPSHIYTGKWNSSNYSVSEIMPWQFGGFQDSSSCSHLAINGGGTKLIFTKMKDDNSDLYLSDFENGNWSNPYAFSKINTPLNDMYPVFQGDTLLTFSSDGRLGYGNLDIFSYDLKSEEIEHLKAPVNGPMDDFYLKYLSPDLALFTSNRSNGKGDDDRYQIKFREPKIEIPVPDSTDFYTFLDEWVDQNIYFDFDKFNLKKDVKIIDELIVFLKKNPTLQIRLEAHADSRGIDAYNDYLSEKRAITVKSELVGLGIADEQIAIEAKGESAPLVKCDKCSEEMHASNRVVIIRLIK